MKSYLKRGILQRNRLIVKKNMKQKVRIELYSYRVAFDDEVRRHSIVVGVSYKTLELDGKEAPIGHLMDRRDSAISVGDYGYTLDMPGFEIGLSEAVEDLKKRLKTVVYENEDIEFEVIDKQSYDAPFYY